MNRSILILAAAAALTASAQSTAPQYVWANLIDGPTAAGDNSISVAVATDNNVYWLGQYGSNDANGAEITYAGQPLFTGAAYAGTSNNGNLTLLKTTPAGDKMWVVYSDNGDFAANNGGVAATSDGGCVIALKMRHTDGYNDRDITINGADGVVSTIDWTEEPGASRHYRALIAKIDADGSVVWTRTISFGSGSDTDKPVTDAVLIGEIVVDDLDNIYIPLSTVTTMDVATASGASVHVAPAVEGVSSDSAATGFITLALDADGYYRNHLALSGTPAEAKCQSLAWSGNTLYIQGLAKMADEAETLSVGGISLSPGIYSSPVIISADSDLNVNWAKAFAMSQVQGAAVSQGLSMTPAGDNLWVCGTYNGCITDPDDSSLSVSSVGKTPREGFIIRLNADNGAWLASRNSRDDDFDKPSALAKTGLTGYVGIIAGDADANRIYVFGYVMNAAVGVFLREYNAETLEANLADGQNNIITGGGVPTAGSLAYDAANGAAYITARGNNAFIVDGSTMETAPVKWGVLLSRFDLPDDMRSGVEGITAGDDTDAPAIYYNLQGIRVPAPAHGLYIVRQGATTRKVIL